MKLLTVSTPIGTREETNMDNISIFCGPIQIVAIGNHIMEYTYAANDNTPGIVRIDDISYGFLDVTISGNVLCKLIARPSPIH
jgi:hypothetical protein